MNLQKIAGPDPWSILAGPTSYGLIECEITRYSHLVDGPGISCECILYIGLIECIVKTGQHSWSSNKRQAASLTVTA